MCLCPLLHAFSSPPSPSNGFHRNSFPSSPSSPFTPSFFPPLEQRRRKKQKVRAAEKARYISPSPPSDRERHTHTRKRGKKLYEEKSPSEKRRKGIDFDGEAIQKKGRNVSFFAEDCKRTEPKRLSHLSFLLSRVPSIPASRSVGRAPAKSKVVLKPSISIIISSAGN